MGNKKGPATGVRPPEPTLGEDTGYDTYLWPRSKTDAKNRLYDYLHMQGWRFDAATSEWHTPERERFQARGRLCYTPDLTEAWIQPPQVGDSRVEHGLWVLPEPILRLRYQKFVQGWGWMTYTEKEGH